MNWKALLRIFLGAIIIGIVVWASDPASWDRIKEARPAPAAMVFVLSALLVLVSAWKWRLVLRALGPGAAYNIADLFRVFNLGVALGIVVSQDVGMATSRITYLSRNEKMGVRQASFSVFLDRWFDLVALAVVTPASGLFLMDLMSTTYSVAFMLVSFTLLLAASLVWPTAATSLFTAGFEIITSFIRRFVQRWKAIGQVTSAESAEAISRTQLIYILTLSLVRILIVGVRAWLVMIALGMDLSLVDTLLLVPVVQLTLLISFTPGGLGFYDAGWYGILLAMGISQGDALLFILVQRALITVSILLTVALTEIPFQLNKWLRRPAPGSSAELL